MVGLLTDCHSRYRAEKLISMLLLFTSITKLVDLAKFAHISFEDKCVN